MAGYISGIITFLSFIIYLRAILQGKILSNKVTWGVWVIVTGMLCVSYYQSVGLVDTIWVSIAYFLGTIVIFISLLISTKGGRWTWVEKTCLVAVFPIIFLWVYFDSPLLALTLTMAIDILGAIPLIHAVYIDRKNEYGPAWLMGFTANAVNLFAVEHWDYANAAYPLYMVVLTFTVTALVYVPKTTRKATLIPQFPNFKPLELTDQQDVQNMVSQFPPYSDFNFTSMWSWNLIDKIAIAELNGNLAVRFTDYLTNEPFYSFIGNRKVNETVNLLLEFSAQSGLSPTLRLIPEISAQRIDTNKFEVVEDRNHFDYIYSIEELRDYPGSKFVKKRNHVNGFLQKYPQVTSKIISLKDRDMVERILQLFEKWHNLKMQKEAHTERHDVEAVKRLLKGVEVFNLITVGIFLEKELVAIFINELVDREYALAHMMKADTSIDDGIYAFLMQKNAEVLSSSGRKLFNYEQDLGLENLRIAKTRFRPQTFLKKYIVRNTNAII